MGNENSRQESDIDWMGKPGRASLRAWLLSKDLKAMRGLALCTSEEGEFQVQG